MARYVNVNKKYKYRVSQEEMSIFWEVHSIGRSKQKSVYAHVPYSERFPR